MTQMAAGEVELVDVVQCSACDLVWVRPKEGWRHCPNCLNDVGQVEQAEDLPLVKQ